MYFFKALIVNYYLTSQEDFQTMIYGFKLATDVTDARVIGMLKEVEEEVTRKVKVCSSIIILIPYNNTTPLTSQVHLNSISTPPDNPSSPSSSFPSELLLMYHSHKL